MSDIREARRVLIARILDGDGASSGAERRAAFDNTTIADPPRSFIDKVATRARDVTGQDVAAARETGLREDQIFELAVCAAVGQATRQHDWALGALEAAIHED